MKHPLYLCNPEKNINCTKESCYINNGPCSSTTKPEFAFTNENGEPIKEDYKKENEEMKRLLKLISEETDCLATFRYADEIEKLIGG